LDALFVLWLPGTVSFRKISSALTEEEFIQQKGDTESK
jgi:hypothetical protein